MLAVLSAIFGFAAPFLPEVLKWFRDKDDKKHELALFRMQMEFADKEHKMRMQELESIADIEEAKVLHQQVPSYGVQLIDAADKWAGSTWGKWLITPAFYMFVVLDFIAGIVRPGITVAVVAFYIAYKYALLQVAGGNILAVWGDNDWAMVTLVLSYWFGHRAAKASFGGNATNGQAGK
jgi:hypothetical protein